MFGIVHYNFQGYQDENWEVGQLTVYSMFRPGSKVAFFKAEHFGSSRWVNYNIEGLIYNNIEGLIITMFYSWNPWTLTI